jgi:predicted transcriptional regulator
LLFCGRFGEALSRSLDCFLQVGLVKFDPDEVDSEPRARYG